MSFITTKKNEKKEKLKAKEKKGEGSTRNFFFFFGRFLLDRFKTKKKKMI